MDLFVQRPYFFNVAQGILMKFLCVLTTVLTAIVSFNTNAAAYQEITVTNGGSITGQVLFKGDDPAPKVYAITKDNAFCGSGNREIDFVKVNNGALQDVVVFLHKVKAGKAFPPLAGKIDQQNCEFLPFLSIMHNNQPVETINQDPVLHNVHSYEQIGKAKKTKFNISQPKPSTIRKHIKLKRGDALKIECDAHDFMHSFVFVAKNPYYARVDKQGQFSIDNIPAGNYELRAWHGTLGLKKTKIKISAKENTNINFSYKK